MHGHDCFPFRWFHFREGLVSKNASVVDEDVHAAEGLNGFVYDGFAPFAGCDGIVAGNGLAAQCFDLFNDLVRWCA